MRLYPPLFLLLTAALLVGCTSCSTHTPPNSGPADPDPDVILYTIATGVAASGEALELRGKTWGACVAGVAMQAWGDYSIGVAIPIHEAVAVGTCEGEVDGVVIDPGPCAGLPGEPSTAEGQDLAREQIEFYLTTGLPLFSALASAGASAAVAKGDTGGCVALTLVSDLLSPAGELVGSFLAVVEHPGAPFESPPMAWDCSACATATAEGVDLTR